MNFKYTININDVILKWRLSVGYPRIAAIILSDEMVVIEHHTGKTTDVQTNLNRPIIAYPPEYER